MDILRRGHFRRVAVWRLDACCPTICRYVSMASLSEVVDILTICSHSGLLEVFLFVCRMLRASENGRMWAPIHIYAFIILISSTSALDSTQLLLRRLPCHVIC